MKITNCKIISTTCLPRNIFLIIIFLICFTFISFAQEIKFVQLINADSLVGKVINNESVRILNGNVQLLHEDVQIFCDKGIQYLETNKAELEGSIKIIQGDVIVSAPKGFYFGDLKKAFGSKGIKLNDGKVTLIADSGEYFFNEKKALFKGKVKLFDDSTTLNSNHLTYFTDIEKAIAIDNVKIEQAQNIIYADTLVYFRKEEISIADGNVFIENKNDNIKIYSDHLENYAQKKESYISGRPLFLQIDTTDDGKIDTLLISSKKMEAFRNENEIYIATDSVKIWRSGFSSSNNLTKYFKKEGKIISYKTSTSDEQPIFWYDENQSYGDSIVILTFENSIKEAFIFGSSFLVSQDTLNPKRFNQMSGAFIKMDFDSSKLKTVFVKGNALSIYYLYDMNEPNGLNKSSSDSALIFLSENRVDEIKIFGNPEAEYHPEELIIDKEKDFEISGFKWIEDRPIKESLLSIRGLFIKAEAKAEVKLR